MGALAIIPAVISIAGTVMSAVSSSNQAKSQAALSRQSATYAQMMANRNNQLAQYAANQSRAAGEYQARLIRERAVKMRSKQVALYGASGVDLSGSPTEVIGDTAGQYERDALNAIYSGNYDAWKYEQGGETSLLEGGATAGRYSGEADAYDSKATNSLLAIPGAVGSTILTAYAGSKVPAYGQSGYDYQPGGYGYKDWS
jgi:hypothetical protein